MARKIYRTMQGRTVDIDKLRAANESVQAVGNMNVNARGDVIGAGGRIVKTKEQIMKEYYTNPKTQVSSAPEPVTARKTTEVKTLEPQKITKVAPKPIQTFKPKKSTPKPAEPKQEASGGIESALEGIDD